MNASKSAFMLIAGLCLNMGAQAEPSGYLNDTGQIWCLSTTTDRFEKCTQENSDDGSTYPGQDGRYGRDAAANYPEQSGLTKPAGSGGNAGFAFTPLDMYGNSIPLVGDPPQLAQTPDCVWDHVTNLIWKLYAVNRNTESSLCQVEGSGGWRLPTRRELLSIVDYAKKNHAMTYGLSEPYHDCGLNFGIYKSSDLMQVYQNASPGAKWSVYSYGDSGFNTSNQCYRAVRSGPGALSTQQNFQNNADGTITDNRTGLVWDKCTWNSSWSAGVSSCLSGATITSWTNALKAAVIANNMNNGIGYKGHNDWRVPNITELESIIDLSIRNPAINSSYGFNTPSTRSYAVFWSSTPQLGYPYTVKTVDAKEGVVSHQTIVNPSIDLMYVRLVRGGQGLNSYDSLKTTITAAITAAVTADNKAYDGTTTATLSGCTLTGVVSPDEVTCSAASATFADAAVGTNKTVTATDITLAGANADQYTLTATTATAKANITAKSLTVAVTAENKVYDGTTTATLSGCTLTGVVSPDEVTCSAASATFADAAVGTNKTVTATDITLAGANADQYTLTATTATAKANITGATANVTIGTLTQTYTGGPLTPSATTTPAGLNVTWTGAPQINAGSYSVSATVNDQNYQGSASGTFIINQALQGSLSVFAASNSIFEGTSTQLSAEGGSAGDVNYSAEGTSGMTCAIRGNTLTASGNAGTCTVTAMRLGDGNYLPVTSNSLAITVTLPQRLLTVGLNGSGEVYSSPSGISCGSFCSAYFDKYTPVTLTAEPASGQYFVGWSGACSGLGTCRVTMTEDRAVTAQFAAIPQTGFTLTVTKTGNGTITSLSPNAGIDCGTTCQANFSAGKLVTLFAQANKGHTFMGWTGAAAGMCGRSASCEVYMSSNQSISGDFKNTYLLILPAIQLLLE